MGGLSRRKIKNMTKKDKCMDCGSSRRKLSIQSSYTRLDGSIRLRYRCKPCNNHRAWLYRNTPSGRISTYNSRKRYDLKRKNKATV